MVVPGGSQGTIWAEFGLDYSKFEIGKQRVNASLMDFDRSVQQSVQAASQRFTQLGTTMSVAVTAPIVLMGRQMINTFADFEQSMANTASVANGTAEQLEAMEQAAREAGESMIFTASESADAMYYMASAGMDAQQSIDALEGVLNLAAATQSDLAFASETVAAALSQFGMKAEESTRVANVYAAAIANSQATMQKLADSMRYAGPIASGFGMTIEETTSALMAMYNAGLRGEQAGTTLRRALQLLSAPVGRAKDVLAELGLTVEDVSPAMNSFADIIDALREAGMSTAQAMELFGEAGSGMSALIRQGSSALREMQAEITGTDEASRMAQQQMDTLQGSLKQMRSAWEELSISLVETFAPSIRDAISSITDAIKWFSDLDPVLQKTLVNVAAVSAAIGPLSLAIGKLLPLFSGPVGWIALVGGAAAGLGTLAMHSRDAERDMNRLYDAAIDNAMAAQEQAGELRDLIREYETLSSRTEIAEEDHARLEEVMERIIALQPELAEGYRDTKDAIDENIGSLRTYVEVLQKQSETEIEHAYLRAQVEAPEKRARLLEIETRLGDQQERRVSLNRRAAELTEELYALAEEAGIPASAVQEWIESIGWMDRLADKLRDFGLDWLAPDVSELQEVAMDVFNVRSELEGLNEEFERLVSEQAGIEAFFERLPVLEQAYQNIQAGREPFTQQMIDEITGATEEAAKQAGEEGVTVEADAEVKAGEVDTSKLERQIRDAQARWLARISLVEYGDEATRAMYGNLRQVHEAYLAWLEEKIVELSGGPYETLRGQLAEAALQVRQSIEALPETAADEVPPAIRQIRELKDELESLQVEAIRIAGDDASEVEAQADKVRTKLDELYAEVYGGEKVAQLWNIVLEQYGASLIGRLKEAFAQLFSAEDILQMSPQELQSAVDEAYQWLLETDRVSLEEHERVLSYRLQALDRHTDDYAETYQRLWADLDAVQKQILQENYRRQMDELQSDVIAGLSIDEQIERLKRITPVTEDQRRDLNNRIVRLEREKEREISRTAYENMQTMADINDWSVQQRLDAANRLLESEQLTAEDRKRLEEDIARYQAQVADDSAQRMMRRYQNLLQIAQDSYGERIRLAREYQGELEDALDTEGLSLDIEAQLTQELRDIEQSLQAWEAEIAVEDILDLSAPVESLTQQQDQLREALQGVVEEFPEAARIYEEALGRLESRIETMFAVGLERGEVPFEDWVAYLTEQLQGLEEGSQAWKNTWDRIRREVKQETNRWLNDVMADIEELDQQTFDAVMQAVEERMEEVGSLGELGELALQQLDEAQQNIIEMREDFLDEQARLTEREMELKAEEARRRAMELAKEGAIYNRHLDWLKVYLRGRKRLLEDMRVEGGPGQTFGDYLEGWNEDAAKLQRQVSQLESTIEAIETTAARARAVQFIEARDITPEGIAEWAEELDPELLQIKLRHFAAELQSLIKTEPVEEAAQVYQQALDRVEKALTKAENTHLDKLRNMAAMDERYTPMLLNELEKRLDGEKRWSNEWKALREEIVEVNARSMRRMLDDLGPWEELDLDNVRRTVADFAKQVSDGWQFEGAREEIEDFYSEIEREEQNRASALLRTQREYQQAVRDGFEELGDLREGDLESFDQWIAAQREKHKGLGEAGILALKELDRYEEDLERERDRRAEERQRREEEWQQFLIESGQTSRQTVLQNSLEQLQEEAYMQRVAGQDVTQIDREIARTRHELAKQVLEDQQAALRAMVLTGEVNTEQQLDFIRRIREGYEELYGTQYQLSDEWQNMKRQELELLEQWRAEVAEMTIEELEARAGQERDLITLLELQERYNQAIEKEARKHGKNSAGVKKYQQALAETQKAIEQYFADASDEISELQSNIDSMTEAEIEAAENVLQTWLTVFSEAGKAGEGMAKKVKRVLDALDERQEQIARRWGRGKPEELTEVSFGDWSLYPLLPGEFSPTFDISGFAEGWNRIMGRLQDLLPNEDAFEVLDKHLEIYRALNPMMSDYLQQMRNTLSLLATGPAALVDSLDYFGEAITHIVDSPAVGDTIKMIAGAYAGREGGIVGMIAGMMAAVPGGHRDLAAGVAIGAQLIGDMIGQASTVEIEEAEKQKTELNRALAEFGHGFRAEVRTDYGFLNWKKLFGAGDLEKIGFDMAEELVNSMSATVQNLGGELANVVTGDATWEDFEVALGNEFQRIVLETMFFTDAMEDEMKKLAGKMQKAVEDGMLTDDEIEQIRTQYEQLLEKYGEGAEQALGAIEDLLPDGDTTVHHEVKGVRITRMAGRDRDLFAELLMPLQNLETLPDLLNREAMEIYQDYQNAEIGAIHAQQILIEQVNLYAGDIVLQTERGEDAEKLLEEMSKKAVAMGRGRQ